MFDEIVFGLGDKSKEADHRVIVSIQARALIHCWAFGPFLLSRGWSQEERPRLSHSLSPVSIQPFSRNVLTHVKSHIV